MSVLGVVTPSVLLSRETVPILLEVSVSPSPGSLWVQRMHSGPLLSLHLECHFPDHLSRSSLHHPQSPCPPNTSWTPPPRLREAQTSLSEAPLGEFSVLGSAHLHTAGPPRPETRCYPTREAQGLLPSPEPYLQDLTVLLKPSLEKDPRAETTRCQALC